MKISKQNTWQGQLTIYMISQGVSMLGSSVVALAMIWYVTLQTNSGTAVAGVTITTFIPQAFVMLFGGGWLISIRQNESLYWPIPL